MYRKKKHLFLYGYAKHVCFVHLYPYHPIEEFPTGSLACTPWKKPSCNRFMLHGHSGHCPPLGFSLAASLPQCTCHYHTCILSLSFLPLHSPLMAQILGVVQAGSGFVVPASFPIVLVGDVVRILHGNKLSPLRAVISALSDTLVLFKEANKELKKGAVL